MQSTKKNGSSKLILLTAIILSISITVIITVMLIRPSVMTNIAGEFIQDMYDPSFLIPEKMAQTRIKNIEVRNKLLDLPSLSEGFGSNQKLASITGEEIHGYLRKLTEFSQQSKEDGNVLWGRIQGSKYEYDATKYVAQELKKWGLNDIAIQRAPVREPVWQPSKIELIVKSHEGERYQFKSAMTAFPSGITDENGITAPIEYVGLGTRADLRGKNIKGKIALLYVRAWEGVLMHSGHLAALRLVEQYDAAGVILWIDLPGNEKFAAQLFSREGFLTDVPWTNIGYEDGLYLRKLIEHSPINTPPEVTLTVAGKMNGNLTTQNLIAQLPGSSEETIMLTAHIDGFFNATLDNGTGVSALMALAHHYSQIPQSKRKYNLLFVVTGDHEQSGAGGIHTFIEGNPELLKKIKLILQLEHLASPGISKELNQLAETNTEAPRLLMVTNLNTWLIDNFTQAASDYGIVMMKNTFQEYAGDVEGLSSTGIPAAGWIEAGYYYHNEADSPDKISAKALENMTRAYAEIIDKLGQDGIERVEENTQPAPPRIYESDELFFLLSQW